MDPHPIRCSCGALQGRLEADAWTNRVICYCDDCQAFPTRLGRAEITLDARGGTDIVQTDPSRVTFTQGRENLACLRLTPKGPLRWYARCCNTPLGNTPASRKIAFVGLLHDCLGDPATLDRAFGPPQMAVFTKFARGEGEQVRQRLPVGGALRFVARLLKARLSGRYRVTPFFRATGEPVAEPDETGIRR